MQENNFEDKIDRLDDLEQKIVKCDKCPLCDERKNAIIGSGTFKASLLIVRDYPEYEEDRTGNAWASPLGRLFEKLLRAASIHTARVYVTYLVHCRPLDNKLVAGDIHACEGHLKELIEILEPSIIAICGRRVLHYFFSSNKKIGNTHGNFFEKRIGERDVLIYPLIHPSGMIKFPMTKKQEMYRDLGNLFSKIVELQLEC